MKTILDETDRQNIIGRINSLSQNSTAQWGKMNVYQMLKHCSMWEDMAMGRQLYKQSLIGKLFGKFGLKDMMKDQPLKPNLPTVPSFKITGSGDVEAEKTTLIALLAEHAAGTNASFIHPFFGVLTREQAGYIVYKHLDHHLKQFGV